MAKKRVDEQAVLDGEDAQLRLNHLRRLMQAKVDAEQRVKLAKSEYARAKQALKDAQTQLQVAMLLDRRQMEIEEAQANHKNGKE